MVVFTCQHCNEALKKPSVEKHVGTKCRRNPYLTCVDCLNDFRGDEYKSHTVCVSEDQRYGGKDFVAKPVAVKQNSWIEVIKACIEKNQNPKYISIFNRLANNTNLPRKKQKFINFMSNGMNMKNTALAEEIFDLFQKAFENANKKDVESIKGEQVDGKNITNGTEEVMTEKKGKDKKRSHVSESEENCEILNGKSSKGEKKNKKKSKANGSLEIEVSTSELILDGDSEVSKKEKKSKKKDKTSKSTNVEPTINGDHAVPETEADTEISANMPFQSLKNGKKSKKKSKSNESSGDLNDKQDLEETDCVSQENDENLNQCVNSGSKKKKSMEGENVSERPLNDKSNDNVEENSTVPTGEGITEEKLSKKKLKKLKKKQQYEAELKQIENESNHLPEEETDRTVEPTKGKKKKRKVSESETADSKRQKVEDIPQDTNNEEPTEVEPNPKAKFHWDDVVKDVLQKCSDQEITLKRLSKKLFAEYQSIKGDRESFEDFMTKFHKKVHKVPGVKIWKDKAKLTIV